MQRFLAALVVAALPGGAIAVTDADRLQIYHEFRAAFDNRHYQDALPLAQKLVAETEEQYGTADRSLVNPLSNLGTTQYRLHDYKNAEESFTRSVKIVESLGGGADRLLLRPLHGLGAAYYAAGEYEEASVALKRALDLSRNLDGLFNAGQMEILDPLIATWVMLERHDEAERQYEYSLRVAESAYGKSDARLMRPTDKYAHWLERMHRYPNARALYARNLMIAEQIGGPGSVLTITPLEGLARTYRLEYANRTEDEQRPPPDPFATTTDFDPSPANTQRLNTDGEKALIMALQANERAQPIDRLRRGTTLVELGDWYMTSGATPKAVMVYREAWKDLRQVGATGPLDAPRQLAYLPPLAAVVRSKLTDRDEPEEHYVEVSFTVTREGHVTDVAVAATDASESQQRSVVSAIKKSHYSPRIQEAEAVDTQGVKFRERLLSKPSRKSS